MIRSAASLVLALSICLMASDTAVAAPRGLPDRPLDLELNAVEIGDVFRLLADVGETKVVLDPCVTGKVDLKLQNAPLPLVFDVLAGKLDLRYEERDGATFVGCRREGDGPVSTTADARLAKRVSMTVREVPVKELLSQLAAAAGLAGVDYRGDETLRTTLSLSNVRLATMLTAIGEQSALKIEIVADRIVATKVETPQ